MTSVDGGIDIDFDGAFGGGFKTGPTGAIASRVRATAVTERGR